MRIIALRTLREFWQRHPDAEQSLRAWYTNAKRANWKSPSDVKLSYRNASILSSNRVVFNIKGNDYRLVESQGLNRRDLEPLLGSRGRVSEILNRKRPLSIEMIRNLHAGLGISADVLVQPYELRRA